MSEIKVMDKPGFIHMVSKIKSRLSGKADIDLSNVSDSIFASKASTAGAGGTPNVAATSTDGVTYTATVPGWTSLVVGKSIIITPNIVSTNVSVKLNVNGLGDKYIRMRTGYNTSTTTNGAVASWLAANKPIEVMYDGTYWIADLQRTSANSISGTIKVENGGTGVTSLEELKTSMGVSSPESVTKTLTTSWTEQSDGTFAQTISVDGVTGEDSQPIVVDIDLDGTDIDADVAVMEAWGCVNRCDPGSGTLKFVCYGNTPTVAIPLNVVVM